MALINTLDAGDTATALTRWWNERHPDRTGARVTDVYIPKSSGMSSETILFRVVDDQGGEPSELVARLIVPDRNLYPSYDFEVERQAMTAVRTTTAVPAPAVDGIESDTTILGAPFLVMQRLYGRVPEDDPPYTATGWVLELDPTAQSALYDNAISTLVGIAGADTSALPAQTLGHPSHRTPAMAQHLDYWEHYYTWAARDRTHPVIEHGLHWMRKNLPDDDRAPVLSWGDARLGNLMFGPDQQVTAVLDWEMTALGPPELDLAWFTVVNRIYTQGFGLPSPPGFPDREQTIARYTEISGHQVRDLAYYEVFAALRSSIILLRLGSMMIDAGLLPADDQLPINNPPSQVLASLLDIEPSRDDAGWFAGRR